MLRLVLHGAGGGRAQVLKCSLCYHSTVVLSQPIAFCCLLSTRIPPYWRTCRSLSPCSKLALATRSIFGTWRQLKAVPHVLLRLSAVRWYDEVLQMAERATHSLCSKALRICFFFVMPPPGQVLVAKVYPAIRRYDEDMEARRPFLHTCYHSAMHLEENSSVLTWY
jgi:hypothetical protein